MGQLFAWYNIFFCISLVIGFLVLIGAALGLVGLDADHALDADHDVAGGQDLDADHDGHVGAPEAHADSSALDVGRVPFTILLMMATLIFGTVGFMSNVVLRNLVDSPMVYGWISIGGAFVVMIVLTNKLARLLVKIMPSTETYNVNKLSFRGCTAALTTRADEKYGTASLTDREGNIHTVTCRTEQGDLPTGRGCWWWTISPTRTSAWSRQPPSSPIHSRRNRARPPGQNKERQLWGSY